MIFTITQNSSQIENKVKQTQKLNIKLNLILKI